MPNTHDHSLINKETIWIVGDGRSGSTWLLEMINYDNQYRRMFEPFHPTKVERMKGSEFFKYIRPEYQDETFYPLASEVFTGQFHHPRVTGGDNRFDKKLLIKDIFAHLFIKWVGTHFPPVKKILLMRHPFAIALSKQKLMKWDWMTEPKQFLNQQALYQDYLQPYKKLIMKTKGYFEKQVLIWSIIHYVSLKQLTEEDILLVFYEDLCSTPEKELKRIFSYLAQSKKDQLTNPKLRDKIKAPSISSRGHSAISQGKDLCDVWRKECSTSQINNGIEILELFGLEGIYNRSLMPNRVAVERFLLSESELTEF